MPDNSLNNDVVQSDGVQTVAPNVQADLIKHEEELLPIPNQTIATPVVEHEPVPEVVSEEASNSLETLEEKATVVEPVIPPADANQAPKPPSKIKSFFSKLGRMSLKKKSAVLLFVIVLSGGAVFGLTQLFSEGTIAALQADSKNAIGFLRPKNWQQSKEENGLTYYTENGIASVDVNRGMILGVQKLGIKYDSLSDSNKTNIRKSFEDEFSGKESFSNDQCAQVANVQTTELDQEGYELAFKVDADCTKLKNGETGGKIKMFVGWSDVNLHVVGVVADTPTWNAEGAELDNILTSIKPDKR